MKIQIKKLREGAVIPQIATCGSAGADLCACLEGSVLLSPGQVAMIPNGIAVAIPEGYAGFVFARSGLASKKDLAPANAVGVIDSDYRGELMTPIRNYGSETRIIEPGERIAQLIIMAVESPEFEITTDLNETARGEGGFGSTGN